MKCLRATRKVALLYSHRRDNRGNMFSHSGHTSSAKRCLTLCGFLTTRISGPNLSLNLTILQRSLLCRTMSLRYRTLAAYLAPAALEWLFHRPKNGPVANTGSTRGTIDVRLVLGGAKHKLALIGFELALFFSPSNRIPLS